MSDKIKKEGLAAAARTSAAALLAAMACVSAVQAADTKFYGDVSEAISMNMQDPIETPQNDKHQVSMARTTARLNLDANLAENLGFVGKVRLVRDLPTNYLKNLQNLGADAAYSGNLAKVYSENTLREFYFDAKLGDRVQLRLGKQQVAWGETDFFQAMDLVHGYDFTWRSFLEPANEELRKPLVMANAAFLVPEADGKLQVLIRPGRMNRRDAVGNTFDVFGGRWANQPNKGFDFRTVTPYNYEHSGGNSDDTTWGMRWSGIAHEINYSLSYLKSYNPLPVISPVNLFPGSNMAPFQGVTPKGILGEIIYPKVDLVGVTASGYSAAADAVFSTEIAYIRDFAFNFGYTNALGLPGFNGVKQKNVVKGMVRMDKNLSFTESALGTEKPAFFSVQLFDTWIQSFNGTENLVQLVGFGQASKEHSVILTGILGLSYRNGRVAPELVAGWDATYGGGFLVPSVTFQFGNNWRFKVEYDHFWNNGARTPANAATERNTALFGYFDHNDQLYAKLVYQF